jgi:SH3 domain-containing YSC84-like protein 1
MKFNTPLPQNLQKECTKAAKIRPSKLAQSVSHSAESRCHAVHSFVDHHNQGLDGVIPHSVLERAKGFAIFSVFKAGFVLSARGTSSSLIYFDTKLTEDVKREAGS